MTSEREALYEIRRQASYLRRGSPERRAIEDAATAATAGLRPVDEPSEADVIAFARLLYEAYNFEWYGGEQRAISWEQYPSRDLWIARAVSLLYRWKGWTEGSIISRHEDGSITFQLHNGVGMGTPV